MKTYVWVNNQFGHINPTKSHLLTSDLIYDHMGKGEWEQIGVLLKTLSNTDKEHIYYAFLHKYQFPFWMKIYSEIKDYELLKSYQLA
ncbi:MAG: hypothetical protein HC819_22355 [Cyclobacteriaceae bacterium]|nr:hypothetical protein [Cyclobacteriaceae bacterium]